METVACALCGSGEYQIHLVGRDLSLRLEGSFRIVRCAECGLLYLNPRPTRDEVEALYPFESYDQYNAALSKVRSRLVRADRAYGLRKRARRVAAWKRGGRLLDVGCATGDFVEYMRGVGDWEVYGVELNSNAARYVREELHIPVWQGTLEEADLPAGHFDVVTMWHVLEHVFDPIATLNQVARVLKPDGVLLCHVPQLDSLDARLWGPYWIGYEIPRHTYVWSRHTLSQLMEATGFRVLDSACFYGSYSAAASSMRFWLRDRLGHEGARRLLERVLFARATRLAFLPAFFVLDRWKKSSSLTAICAPVQPEVPGGTVRTGTRVGE